MLTSEHIRNQSPVGAVSYRLLAKLSDGSSRLFPADTGGFFRVGEPPANVPIGKYTVCYYDGSGGLIKYLEDAIDLNPALDSPLNKPAGSGQLQLSFLNAGGTAAALPAKSSRASLPPLSLARTDADPSTLSENERELRRHMQAMDVEERQQEFIKSSAYVTELGEAFTLNRLMRRELLELHRIIVEHSQRAYQDIDQVKSTVHELLSLQKAVLEHAATTIARPPPPPPDFVGLGHSALAVVKDLGVALLSRSVGKEGAALSRASETQAKAQISDGASVKEAEISTLPSAAGKTSSAAAVTATETTPRDAVTRMLHKLHGLSDAQIASAMSSVDGWKGLLDSLRQDDAKDAMGDSAASEKVALSSAAPTVAANE